MQIARQLLLVGLFVIALARSVLAVSCAVAAPHGVSEPEQAFLRSDYDRAASLYTQALQQTPNDPKLTAGLVDVLLKQQKIQEVDDLITRAAASNPKSVELQTALGFVQYREGKPWLAGKTASLAGSLDICYPRAHLLNMRLLRLNSMYKTAAAELRTAHLLDPSDPEIRRYWIQTLPLKQRIAEAEAYLETPTGSDSDDIRRMRLYLDELKKADSQPRRACQLASSDVTTEIKFAPIMRDATHISSFGLDVKLNAHNARLEIDTGASGLLISRSIAKQAGLEAFSASEVEGIGKEGEKSAYTAYVDSIQIGSLEFKDCEVTVLDSRNVAGIDGLIGMDVFSNLLVTLDYPMRKLGLRPLPARPDDETSGKPSLETSDAEALTTNFHDRYIAPEMKDWTPIYRSGHNLLMPAELNESALKLFILDTGSFTTSISPDAAREVTKVHSDSRIVVHGISGKVEKVYSADNITFRFANLRQKAQEVVSFDTSNIGKATGVDVAGLIGFTTLGQLTLRIDYRDALVKFEYDPNRGFRQPARY